MLVGCPECTVRRGSHVSLPRLPNRACSITPLTHNHPSLPPSLPVALFHSSIDSFLSVQKKHYTVRALANQCSMCSLSEWFLNIVHKLNQTSLSTLPGTFIVSLSEVKTCRLITSHKIGTPYFYKEQQSSGGKSARLGVMCGTLGLFPRSPVRAPSPLSPMLHGWRFYAAMSILTPLSPRSVRRRFKYTFLLLSVGWKLSTGQDVCGPPLFLFRTPIEFGWKRRTDGDGCGRYQNVYDCE